MAALDRKATQLLILDDNSDSRFFLRSNLVRSGFGEVHTTGDPYIAMTHMQMNKIGAVLVSSEFKTSGGGIAFVKKLRDKENSPNAAVPILLVVPSGDANIIQQGIYSGVNDFVVRPILLNRLLKRIEKVCLNRAIAPRKEILSKLDRRNGAPDRRSGKARRLKEDPAHGQLKEDLRSGADRRVDSRRTLDRRREGARSGKARRLKEDPAYGQLKEDIRSGADRRVDSRRDLDHERDEARAEKAAPKEAVKERVLVKKSTAAPMREKIPEKTSEKPLSPDEKAQLWEDEAAAVEARKKAMEERASVEKKEEAEIWKKEAVAAEERKRREETARAERLDDFDAELAAPEPSESDVPEEDPPLDLTAVLADHKLWLETSGREGAKASLPQEDLQGADFKGADLSNANLKSADLADATFEGATLDWADLRRAYLSGANLIGASLHGAKLRHADLSLAKLDGADLRAVDLAGVNLQGAILKDADVTGANLLSANLKGARLKEVTGLTQSQINKALADADTELPSGIRFVPPDE